MREIGVYKKIYITLSLGISNVMLRAFGNFRRVWYHIVSLTLIMNKSTPLYRGLFTTELKPAYGTHVSEFGGPTTVQCKVNWQIGLEYLGTEIPLCLNMPIGTEDFVSCLTSPKLQNLKGDAKLLRSLGGEDTHFSVSSKEGRVV
jgi:hypothetical protein